MYKIETPKVEFSHQTRSFTKGLTSSLLGNVRHASTQSLALNTKSSSTLSSNAYDDIAQAVISVKDCERVKAAFDAEYKSVEDSLSVLNGEAVKSTAHPLVKACSDLYIESEIVNKAGGSLNAADTQEQRERLSEVKKALDVECDTINNRFSKSLIAAKKSFGAALARCADVDDVVTLLDENDTTIVEMLPAHWLQVEVPTDMQLGKATHSPASKLGSPERTSSVILTQCRMALAKDNRSRKAKERDAIQQGKDATTTEIAALLKGAG